MAKEAMVDESKTCIRVFSQKEVFRRYFDEVVKQQQKYYKRNEKYASLKDLKLTLLFNKKVGSCNIGDKIEVDLGSHSYPEWPSCLR